MTSEIFSLQDDFGGTVYISVLNETILSSGISVPCTGVSENIPEDGDVKIDFDGDLTPSDLSDLQSIVKNHQSMWLAQEKKNIFSEIDKEIQRRVEKGFSYSGKQFSLSTNAQIKWSGLLASKDLMSYPLTVPTIDNTAYYSVQDASEVETIWRAATSTVKDHVSAGTVAKQNVLAANTVDAANLAKQNYLSP